MCLQLLILCASCFFFLCSLQSPSFPACSFLGLCEPAVSVSNKSVTLSCLQTPVGSCPWLGEPQQALRVEKAEQDKESRDWWHLNGSVCVPAVHHKVSPAVQALPRGSEVEPQHLLPSWEGRDPHRHKSLLSAATILPRRISLHPSLAEIIAESEQFSQGQAEAEVFLVFISPCLTVSTFIFF